ncbi:MAG: hypothetical protein JNL90_05180 [Planctomycetes bacterium]|nr:hypothetical protein [Planctomycetota bacterium]
MFIKSVVVAGAMLAVCSNVQGNSPSGPLAPCTWYPLSSVVGFDINTFQPDNCANESGNAINCPSGGDPDCYAIIEWAGPPSNAQPWVKACNGSPLCWIGGGKFWISCDASIDWS